MQGTFQKNQKGEISIRIRKIKARKMRREKER
jgi:hypothetical protein